MTELPEEEIEVLEASEAEPAGRAVGMFNSESGVAAGVGADSFLNRPVARQLSLH